jgi:hypothetical protein
VIGVVGLLLCVLIPGCVNSRTPARRAKDEGIELLAEKYTDITWLLDRDAFAKAMKLAKEYRMLFRNTRVVRPARDPKDMTVEEFNECLREI